MKLIEALELLERPVSSEAPRFTIFLACGFTPLHLQTFLAANLRKRMPERPVEIRTGLFGDLTGNIERLDAGGLQGGAVAIEWSDLDPRLGIRSLGGWRPASLRDIVESAERAAGRLLNALKELSRSVPTTVCMPTLPVPPVFWTAPERAGSFELHLHQTAATLAASLSELPGIQIVNAQFLAENSPLAQRFDLKSEVSAGFPYTLPHASAMGESIAALMNGRPAKKGLITDLDDTLWGGILGEVGTEGVSWHLERRTHMHGLYQQVAASLAGAGILVGVASKNDRALVDQAFDRSDLLISRNDIFPFEAHWSPKSESVKRILEAWNVGADSVIFVDDSPMEVAEVQAAFPAMECVVFPKNDYSGIMKLLKNLRSAFGKPFLTDDDSLRLGSIRNAGAWRDTASGGDASDEFLRSADASIEFSLSRDSSDTRAFELVNKTNQFNLNGRRLSETEWRSFCADSSAVLLTASYKDKFGPLGKVAVLLGRTQGQTLRVSSWVMSCRAFSRRIEHHSLQYLFDVLGVDQIVFDYERTSRNGPLQECFEALFGSAPVPGITLSKEQFSSSAPALLHRVEGTINV